MFQLNCATNRTYEVRLTPDIWSHDNRALAQAVGTRRALVITDATVDRLYGQALRAQLATLPHPGAVEVLDLSEQSKTMATVLAVVEAARTNDLGRRDVLVAFGGGVCCDVVSVAAALLRRGTPYICVPTTLVGQVDAGIGLKGGVNLGTSKNYLGCFEPPAAVLIDPQLLTTVPVAELRAGMAEVLKMAIVCDRGLFDRIRESGAQLVESGFAQPGGLGAEVVAWSIRLMLGELARNCYERDDLHRLVDFGHTFGPRLEEQSGFRLRHGEAVAVDMALSCALAVELGLLAEDDLRTVLSCFLELGLPIITSGCRLVHLQEAMAAATLHRDGALNLVLPTAIGSATFVERTVDVPTLALEVALRRVATFAALNDAPVARGQGSEVEVSLSA